MTLPDISHRFLFTSGNRGNHFFKEASGELGVPSQVMTHRVVADQRTVSSGTGDHAGHLIGIQFGAPGDLRNLGLQNANTNTFAPKPLQEAFQGSGGSYHNLESQWAEQLRQGYAIRVTITDKYRPGENRPFTRSVTWTETAPNGQSQRLSLEFVNFSSPQSRAKA